MENKMYDLGRLGAREIYMAIDLLKAMLKGYPDDFDDDGVQIAFNPYSGNVFLTNENYDSCMERDGELEQWYFLGYHGYEGFLDDLIEQYNDGEIESEDWEELADICERNGMDEKAEEIRKRLEAIA